MNKYDQIGGLVDSKDIFKKYNLELKKKLKIDKTYNGNIDNLEDVPEDFILSSLNLKYLEWIVQSYIYNGINKYEDLLSRVKPSLDDYEYLIISKKLQTNNGKYDNEKIISNYCGLSGCISKIKGKEIERKGLDELLDKYIDELTKHKIKNKKIKIEIEEKVFYDGKQIKIFKPETEKEAIYYGKNTKWCTASEYRNMFQYYYNDGPLYIIVSKESINDKYQLHFESNQYMDRDDKPISLSFLISKYPELVDLQLFNNININVAIETNNINIIERSNHNSINDDTFNKAIFSKNIDIINIIYSYGAKPNNTSYYYSILTGDINIIKLVYDKYETKPYTTEDFYTYKEYFYTDKEDPFLCAIKTKNIEIINLVYLHSGNEIHNKNSLNVAIETNNIDIIKLIIDLGGKPKSDEFDINSFDLAINTNNIDIIKLIIDHGGKPNKYSFNEAIYTNNIDIIKFVYNLGVLPAENYSLNVALDANVKKEIIELLIYEFKLKPNNESLNKAINKKNIDNINLILKNGGICNNTVSDNTTINKAIYSSSIEIIKLILEFGCKPNSLSLDNAIFTRNIDIINFIIGLGCKPNSGTLINAIRSKDMEIIKLIYSLDSSLYKNTFRTALETLDMKIIKFIQKCGGIPDIKSIDHIIRHTINDKICEIIIYLLKFDIDYDINRLYIYNFNICIKKVISLVPVINIFILKIIIKYGIIYDNNPEFKFDNDKTLYLHNEYQHFIDYIKTREKLNHDHINVVGLGEDNTRHECLLLSDTELQEVIESTDLPKLVLLRKNKYEICYFFELISYNYEK